MRVFRDIRIFPSHYKHTAIVSWIVDPIIAGAKFYVYRKWDGGAEWELLNTTPVEGANTYADTGFNIKNKIQVPAYKLLAITGEGTPEEKEYESEEVGLFTPVERKAFGIAQNITRSLYLQARQDGIPVLYYPSIKNGPISGNIDDVGQRTTATCLDGKGSDPDSEPDYGEYYAGGYYRPFLTYVRFIGSRLVRENILDVGLYDESVQNAVFLAHPPVRSGDMIVDVSTDRRWIVSNNVKAQLVKSVIPVAYDAVINLQAHNDPCYAVPIPDNYPEMIRRLTWPQTVS